MRRTRKQQQAHTRSCLMRSAAKVFTKRGLQQASIDEVAADAGFTKGAFYANFKSKEELFLAMLDERFAQRIEAMDRIVSSDHELGEQVREGGLDFTQYVSSDREWQRLFFEFSAYAARNDDFREELVTRYRTLRGRFAELLGARAESLEIEPPVPVDQVAQMLFAMGHGVALEALLEPEAVGDDLYGSLLTIFFTGLRALADGSAEPIGVSFGRDAAGPPVAAAAGAQRSARR